MPGGLHSATGYFTEFTTTPGIVQVQIFPRDLQRNKKCTYIVQEIMIMRISFTVSMDCMRHNGETSTP